MIALGITSVLVGIGGYYAVKKMETEKKEFEHLREAIID